MTGTMPVMRAKQKCNIVGGPKDGGYEPMALGMEGCAAVAWAIPCRLSDASHLYLWDAEEELWRYVGAGRHEERGGMAEIGG